MEVMWWEELGSEKKDDGCQRSHWAVFSHLERLGMKGAIMDVMELRPCHPVRGRQEGDYT
jgi:hypothetical protein